MTITDNFSAPLVAVVGATGQQGGSVVAVLKASAKQYRIRAFTRDTTKPAAQALAQDGVDVIAVNLVVENADAVRKAFEGVDIALYGLSQERPKCALLTPWYRQHRHQLLGAHEQGKSQFFFFLLVDQSQC